MKWITPLLLILLVAAMPAITPEPSPTVDAFTRYVEDNGAISMPEDFRKNFSHLGSWFVPEGDASGFHDVYMQPEAVGYYRKNGRFPDGAVLIKELRAHDSKAMTTGTPAWANQTLKQWFVMVKNEKGRFKESANWGEGWGWALFRPGKNGNVSQSFRADCLGCHIPRELYQR